MPQNSADPDCLSELLASSTEWDAEEIRQAAADIEIEAPEDADWEPLDEDWEDTPAYQDY